MELDKLYEAHLKCDFLCYLRKGKAVNSRSVIASEYVLGSTGRRADLAILNGSRLTGIEVKSKYDSLVRLKNQLHVYTACFDEVILLVDERHVQQALKMADLAVSIYKIDGQRNIVLCRAAECAPQISVHTRVQLLSLQELRRLNGYPAHQSLKRSLILRESANLPMHVVDEALKRSFRAAFTETSASFWRYVKPRGVPLDALAYLSRFAPDRDRLREKEDDKRKFWDTWRQKAAIALQDTAA
jgi:hypothetical protein